MFRNVSEFLPGMATLANQFNANYQATIDARKAARKAEDELGRDLQNITFGELNEGRRQHQERTLREKQDEVRFAEAGMQLRKQLVEMATEEVNKAREEIPVVREKSRSMLKKAGMGESEDLNRAVEKTAIVIEKVQWLATCRAALTSIYRDPNPGESALAKDLASARENLRQYANSILTFDLPRDVVEAPKMFKPFSGMWKVNGEVVRPNVDLSQEAVAQ